jgi:thiamine transport system ATP-binding protein
VALARALLRARPLLLLDEPFAALGPALRAEMLELVARIRAEQDATLLMVTHQPEDARRIAGSTVLVDDGRAHPPVPTEALFADPPPALRAYLG